MDSHEQTGKRHNHQEEPQAARATTTPPATTTPTGHATPESTYLIAATFRIEGQPELFPGVHDPLRRWNGWARPRFSRDVAEHIATWVNADDGDRTATLHWEGEALVHAYLSQAIEDPDYEPQRYEPDTEGRYSVGAGSWIWEDITAPEGEDPHEWLTALAARTSVHAAAAHAAMTSAYAGGGDAKLAYAASTAAGATALAAHDLAVGNLLCRYCEGRLTRNEQGAPVLVHAEDGDRIPPGGPGDLVTGLHNRAGRPVQPADVIGRFPF